MRNEHEFDTLDEFLSHSGKGSGPKYLKGWKKDGDGNVIVWMAALPAPYWNHPWSRVVEVPLEEGSDERVTEVWSGRWGCHESEAVLKKQFFRDKKTGEREYPPVLCPSCRFIEVIRGLVRSGKISWVTPVFEFQGDADPDQQLVQLAGGIYNHFGSKDLTPNQIKELRRAGVNRKDSWKQTMTARLQYLLQVVVKPEDGIQVTFEGTGLVEKIKEQIKGVMRRKGGADHGDFRKHPYPIEWTFDESQLFDKKYSATALEEQPSDAILAVLRGEKPDVSGMLQPGNCFELRAQMEAHLNPELRGFIDFDEIFEPARKAGLMEPPRESKEDAEEESEGAHEIAGGETEELRVVVFGEDHECWEAVDYVVTEDVKGAQVELEVPEDVDDARVGMVEKACRKAGAKVVTEATLCTHCSSRMTTIDPACPSCGAEYSDEGELLTRPCVKTGCGAQVKLEGEGPKWICGKCGTIHEMRDAGTPDEAWSAAAPPPAPAADEPVMRRRPRAGAAAPAAKKPEEKAGRKVGVPFAG